MIGADVALILIAGALLLGVCAGVWLGWRLHTVQVQIDAEVARARWSETLIRFPATGNPGLTGRRL